MRDGIQVNALDMRSLQDLKRLSRQPDSREALRGAAKQFEAMFLQMMIKSMRDATPKNGPFDSEQTRMFVGLQDQQMAMEMAQGRGVGLAEVIFRQMGGKGSIDGPEPTPGDEAAKSVFDVASIPRRMANQARPFVPQSEGEHGAGLAGRIVDLGNQVVDRVVGEAAGVAEGARGFVRRVWNDAVTASRETGIPPQFMVAQAALETGWGRAVLKHEDGRSSHNLFNIKAGSSWNGAVVELPVTEYANGRAYTEKARFRSYDSFADAFRDYANLLGNNKRYAKLIGEQDAAAFAHGLQDAGFATDPHYADKLMRVIGGNTLKVALSG